MRKGSVITLIALALGLVAGLLHLFQLRFETGDVYPPYSSQRADPLGTKALHDALSDFVSVHRNFSPLTRLNDGTGICLLLLGVDPESALFTTNQYRALETFVRTGGRLVVSFKPVYVRPRFNRFSTTPSPGKAGGPTKTSTNLPPTIGPRTRTSIEDFDKISVEDRWGFRFNYAELERDRTSHAFQPVTANRVTDIDGPDQLSVNTALCFDPPSPDWQSIYTRRVTSNTFAVIMERRMGRGSLIFTADSYYFSNEALRQEREARLLTWVVGSSERVLFDETHLGTTTDPGIATMARRYNLQGLAAAVLILAALYIWANASSFLPADEADSQERSHQVLGRDSAEGFTSLLRRNIAPVDLMKICLEQWNRGGAASRPPTPAKLEAMQRVIDEQNALAPNLRDPVTTYRKFCEILNQRT